MAIVGDNRTFFTSHATTLSKDTKLEIAFTTTWSFTNSLHQKSFQIAQ